MSDMYWFPILVVAALAPILLVWWEVWSTSRRRRVSFGLRSIFLVMISVAVGCGVLRVVPSLIGTIISLAVLFGCLFVATLMVYYVVTDVFPIRKSNEEDVVHPTITIGDSVETNSVPRRRRRFERWRMARTQWGRNGRS